MSEKRFKLIKCKLYDMQYNKDIPIATFRNVDDAEVICSWLNELYDENRELRQELNDCEKFRHSVFKRMNELTDQLKEKEEDEKLYAQEIVELNKTKKELIEFNELGGNY